MFQLIQHIKKSQLAFRQAPVLIVSFVIAEMFYKFHSFTLECGAFLLTWYLADAAVECLKIMLRGLARKQQARRSHLGG